MKKCLLLSISCLAAVLPVYSQVHYDSYKQVTATVKSNEVRISELSDKIQLIKNDMTRKTLISAMSKYIVEGNIYPNKDAIDLLYAYNREVSDEQIIANPQTIKTLAVKSSPMSQHNPVIMMRQIYPGLLQNGFHTLSSNFQDLLTKLPTTVFGGFRDSLNIFRDKVLPAISGELNNIPFAQIEYFNNSLQDINQWMNDMVNGTSVIDASPAIEGLMDDFFVYPIKTQNPQNPHLIQPGSQHIEHTITPHSLMLLSSSLDLYDDAPPEANGLANADIYVYKRDASGNWEKDARPFAFEVHYGPNSLKYRLKPGCDTLSLFKYHPTSPASVLPLGLPQGNICFLLKDLSNGRLIIRPNINLADNNLVDNNKLIILCFKGEN